MNISHSYNDYGFFITKNLCKSQLLLTILPTLHYAIRPSDGAMTSLRLSSPPFLLLAVVITFQYFHLFQVFVYSIHASFPNSPNRSVSDWHRIHRIFDQLLSLDLTTLTNQLQFSAINKLTLLNLFSNIIKLTYIYNYNTFYLIRCHFYSNDN